MKEGNTEREESSHSRLCNLKVDQTGNRSLLEIRRSPTEAVNQKIHPESYPRMGGSLGSYMLAPSVFMALFGPRTLGDSVQGRSSASDSESPLPNPSPRL